MLLNFSNEIPNFGTSFRILETECVVNSIWLCPYDKGIWKGAHVDTLLSGAIYGDTKRTHPADAGKRRLSE